MTTCFTSSLQNLPAMSILSSWELYLLRLEENVFEILFFFHSKDCKRLVVTEQNPSSPVAKPGLSPEPRSKVRNDVLCALANLQTAVACYWIVNRVSLRANGAIFWGWPSLQQQIYCLMAADSQAVSWDETLLCRWLSLSKMHLRYTLLN